MHIGLHTVPGFKVLRWKVQNGGTCIHKFESGRVCVCIHNYMCTCTCVRACVCACVRACKHACIFEYAYVNVCIYMYVRVYMIIMSAHTVEYRQSAPPIFTGKKEGGGGGRINGSDRFCTRGAPPILISAPRP